MAIRTRKGWRFTRRNVGLGGQTDDEILLDLGATFIKHYDLNQSSLDADESTGSATATFTASRGSTTPATIIDSAGLFTTTTTSDVARFVGGYYDSTGFVSAPEVLMEGARTNLVTESGNMSDADWSGTNVTDTGSSGTAPDGSNDATRLVGTGGNWFWREDLAHVGGLNTISMWVKSNTGSDQTFRLFSDGGTENSADFTASPTEWRRFTWTAGSNEADRITGVRANAAGDDGDLLVWGAQFEATDFASSYIPTTSAALTRNEEILEYVIADNRTAATESCIIVFRPNYASGTAGGDQFLIDSDTKSRNIRFTSGSNDFEIFPNETDTVGSTVADLVNASWAANATLALGYSVKSTGNPNIAGYFDGAADGTDDNDDFTSPLWGTNFQIGADNGTANNFSGGIKAIAFFDNELSAADHATAEGLLNP